MKRVGTLVLKNAAANVVRGLATAAVAVVLPHFLTHALDKDRFATWSLILQIAAYAGFLDFGLQTAVARFLAQAMEGGSTELRDRLVSTALGMLSAAGLLAMLVISIIVWKAPHLFPGIPPDLTSEFCAASLCMGLGACLMLPLSVYTGVLIGLHRNEFPAASIGLSRILGASLVLIAVGHTHSLVVLAGCITLANMLGAAAQALAVKRLLPSLHIGRRHMQLATARELTRYCVGLSVWAFTMLLVSGLDLTIVGHVQFEAVGAYAIASVLTMFFAGLNQSVISALMTPIVALHVHGQADQLRSILLRVTRLNATANLALACAYVVFGQSLLRVWVGPDYAGRAYPILCILVVAQALRLTASPYAVTLIAIGQQNRGIMPSAVEAVTNLGLSIAGAMLFGAIGVAWGTLVATLVGLLATLLYTVPRTGQHLGVDRRDLLREAFGRSVLPLSPLLLCFTRNLLPFRMAPVVEILPFLLATGTVLLLERRGLAEAGQQLRRGDPTGAVLLNL